MAVCLRPQLLLILEEQESGTASRTRAAFDEIDLDRNGELSYAEFEAGAKALLHVGATQVRAPQTASHHPSHRHPSNPEPATTTLATISQPPPASHHQLATTTLATISQPPPP